MCIFLCYAIYALIRDWHLLSSIQFCVFFLVLFFVIYFIWMQVTYKFIDIRDGFKVKDIGANIKDFEKSRNITKWGIIFVLIVIIGVNLFP